MVTARSLLHSRHRYHVQAQRHVVYRVTANQYYRCVPNRYNHDDLFQTIVGRAFDAVLLLPAALSGFYRQISVAAYERDRDKKKKEMPVYDFAGRPIWRPKNEEYASPHVAYACRALEELGQELHQALAAKLQSTCHVSILGHMLSTCAEGQTRAVVYAADRGPIALLAGVMKLDQTSQQLGQTYAQFRDVFASQQRFSLSWVKDQLLASLSKTRTSPNVSLSFQQPLIQATRATRSGMPLGFPKGPEVGTQQGHKTMFSDCRRDDDPHQHPPCTSRRLVALGLLRRGPHLVMSGLAATVDYVFVQLRLTLNRPRRLVAFGTSSFRQSQTKSCPGRENESQK